MGKKRRQRKAAKWASIKDAFRDSGLVVGQTLFCDGDNQKFDRPVLNFLKLSCFKCKTMLDSLDNQVRHVNDHHPKKVCSCYFQIKDNPRVLAHTLIVPSTFSNILAPPAEAENSDAPSEPSSDDDGAEVMDGVAV